MADPVPPFQPKSISHRLNIVILFDIRRHLLWCTINGQYILLVLRPLDTRTREIFMPFDFSLVFSAGFTPQHRDKTFSCHLSHRTQVDSYG